MLMAILLQANANWFHDNSGSVLVAAGLVANALAWYGGIIKMNAARDAKIAEHEEWCKKHERLAELRDTTINDLKVLITRVVATNEGQEKRIKMLEEENRDTRHGAKHGRLT